MYRFIILSLVAVASALDACTHEAVFISGLEATDRASFGGTFLLVEELEYNAYVVYQQAGGGSNYLYHSMDTWRIGPYYINGTMATSWVYSRDYVEGSTCPDEHKSWVYWTTATTAWIYDNEINCTAIAIGALLQLLSLVN